MGRSCTFGLTQIKYIIAITVCLKMKKLLQANNWKIENIFRLITTFTAFKDVQDSHKRFNNVFWKVLKHCKH